METTEHANPNGINGLKAKASAEEDKHFLIAPPSGLGKSAALLGIATQLLDEDKFTPTVFRTLTGLTFRQVNDWDGREVLPHYRKGSRGWRKWNAWQAMAVSILSALHTQFGVPLGKLRGLLQWMLGYDSTPREYHRSPRAEERVLPFSHEEQTPNEPMPLFNALSAIAVGFPVFLMTDFEQSCFLDEFALLDCIRQGTPLKIATVFQVNDHLNAVLLAATGKRFPVTLRASDLESPEGKSKIEMEEQIVEFLHERKFERLIIEPFGGGYHFEIQRDFSAKDLPKLIRILEEHKYQSVTVKMKGGKISRVSQAVPVKLSSG